MQVTGKSLNMKKYRVHVLANNPTNVNIPHYSKMRFPLSMKLSKLQIINTYIRSFLFKNPFSRTHLLR